MRLYGMHFQKVFCGDQKEIWIMKKHITEFCKRGLMFAWGGPVITALIWYCLWKTGKIESLSVQEAFTGVLTTSALAFIAAGITIVHQIEKLPRVTAALIQGAVLYVDYLVFYLINGWITTDKIQLFTVIFALGFVAIWVCIYIPTRIRVEKMNRRIGF